MLKIKVSIGAATAIKAGRAKVGDFAVELGEAFVMELGPTAREVLLEVLDRGIPQTLTVLPSRFRNCSKQPANPVEPTVEAVRLWLTEAAEILREERKKEAEEKQQEQAKREATVDKFLSMPIEELITTSTSNEYSSRLYGKPQTHIRKTFYHKNGYPKDLYAPAEDHPTRAAYDALCEAVDARLAELRAAEEARWKAEEDRLLEQFVREEEAKTEAIRDFVKLHGTPSQEARLAEGLLPEKELLDLARNRLFSHIESKFKRYERLTKDDAEHDPDCDHDSNIKFEVEPATELSEDAYKTLVELRRTVGEGFKIEARMHSVECRNDGCPQAVTRPGALVSTDWYGHALSREYAL